MSSEKKFRQKKNSLSFSLVSTDETNEDREFLFLSPKHRFDDMTSSHETSRLDSMKSPILFGSQSIHEAATGQRRCMICFLVSLVLRRVFRLRHHFLIAHFVWSANFGEIDAIVASLFAQIGRCLSTIGNFSIKNRCEKLYARTATKWKIHINLWVILRSSSLRFAKWRRDGGWCQWRRMHERAKRKQNTKSATNETNKHWVCSQRFPFAGNSAVVQTNSSQSSSSFVFVMRKRALSGLKVESRHS